MTEKLAAFKAEMLAQKPKIATRKSSEMCCKSSTTRPRRQSAARPTSRIRTSRISKGMTSIKPGDFSGRYIHYGIREHAMGAVMNGIALHGGFVPYGGTSWCSRTTARPSIRLSALMGLRVLYVLTHDSIGVGEDGPTHQPIEHLAMLRATPNLYVFRPAARSKRRKPTKWRSPRAARRRPSRCRGKISRNSALKRRRKPHGERRLRPARHRWRPRRDPSGHRIGGRACGQCRGAPQRRRHKGRRRVDALLGAVRTANAGLPSRGPGAAPRVAIEAAGRFGWDRWLAGNGTFIGMNGFGASGPAPKVYEHFGITVDAAVNAAKKLLHKA